MAHIGHGAAYGAEGALSVVPLPRPRRAAGQLDHGLILVEFHDLADSLVERYDGERSCDCHEIVFRHTDDHCVTNTQITAGEGRSDELAGSVGAGEASHCECVAWCVV